MYIRTVRINWNQVPEDSYLRSIDSLKSADEIEFTRSVTFLAGENGTGKSTLLEAIAIAEGFNPEGGTRNYSFSTYDSHSELSKAIRLSRTGTMPFGYFLRAESFYNVATREREYAQGRSMRLHEKSHGESFLALAQSMFQGKGIYILDEPEAALSPQRQLSLLIEIDRCRKLGGQFLIATHSPILLGLPDAQILSFDDGRITQCSYEETSSYQITSLFMKDRDRLLSQLLEENYDES